MEPKTTGRQASARIAELRTLALALFIALGSGAKTLGESPPTGRHLKLLSGRF